MSSEKQAIRGHNLDMRVATDQFRMRELKYLQNQSSSQEELKTPPFAKTGKSRGPDDSRADMGTAVGSFMTQHTSNHQMSSYNRGHHMGTGRQMEQYPRHSISPFNQKYMNSGNRQSYNVQRMMRRGTTPHESHHQNTYMSSSQYMMMANNQNSQRKVLRSTVNEHRQHGFDITPPGSLKHNMMRSHHLTGSEHNENGERDVGRQYQMVRPFESQHKDVYNSVYESHDPFKMPMHYGKSHTPKKTKNTPTSSDNDQHGREMIIPKDFSSHKFQQNSLNSFKGRMGQLMGNTNNKPSSFGSVIGDSQVEPQEMSNLQMSKHSDNNWQHYQNHQYLESYRSLQAHQAMVKKCPMHGENSDFDDYKETMALMAA